MKKISSLLLFALVLALFIESGCKKQPTATNTQVTGNLYGYVTLYDQYGGKIFSGLNAVAVTLNTSSGSASNTTTDSTGRYGFSSIAQGQYTIGYTCPGYGSIMNSALGFLGEGNIDHDAKLSAIPNFFDSILAPPTDTLGNVVLQGTFSGSDTRKRTYVVFVGSSPSVSSLPANYLVYYTGTANNNLTTFTVKIPVSDLNDAGFTSGSTVYFAAYGAAANFASTSEVEDLANTGRLSFNAISTNAATTSFVLP